MRVCTTVYANRAGPEMSTSTKLLDNRDQRVKWKIFEDRDTSMLELTFLCIEASPECDPNLGTRLTHFRYQSCASSPLRELHRANRSIFVQAFVRDGKHDEVVSPRQIRKLVSEMPQSDICCQLSRPPSHNIEIVRESMKVCI